MRDNFLLNRRNELLKIFDPTVQDGRRITPNQSDIPEAISTRNEVIELAQV
jgi:hypothetical protein